jgi:ornithine cyclodeaminase/alanine dehydrogenase-like protein (mu-crystallin family)
MPLYLTEEDVNDLLDAESANAAVEECERKLARSAVKVLPRARLGLDGGALTLMAAVDLEAGLCGLKSYVAGRDRSFRPVVLLQDERSGELVAVVEARRLGQLRTGAASAIAALTLARPDPRTLGVIGCGYHAVGQVECIRAALPSIERVGVFCRSEERMRSFCERFGAEPARDHRQAAEADIVVTVTSSPDPVLRGEWLRPGALVCAVGANVPGRRELDNTVLERASLVCCDLKSQAQIESGDLIEPIAGGVLDWLEVHELHELVSGELTGRQSDQDIIVFKSNGIAAWDLAAAALVLERARIERRGIELRS